MDMNPLRRRREREIAKDVARDFFRDAPKDTVAPPELLAHVFGFL